MKTKILGLVLITIMAALAFSGTVFAEGEVPQPDAAEEPPTPAEQPALTEEPKPAEEAAPPVETAPAEEPLTPVETEPVSPAEEPPFETQEPAAAEMPEADEPGSGAPAEIAADVPAITVEDADTTVENSETSLVPGTFPEPQETETVAPALEVQVVDTAGEPLNMASQLSAQALAGADPYFTSGIYTYRFSEVPGYCTHSPGSDDPAHCFDPSSSPAVVDAIQYAIDYISDHGTNPNDGLINVEWDTNKYEQDVSINAGDFSVPSALKGLIGKANETTGVFPTIKGNVSINGVTSGFTLSGFIIEGGVTISSVTGALNLTDLDVSDPAGGGIQITNQKGNVVMTNVRSSHNANTGVNIDNTLGGNVTITNSAFDYNGTGGSIYGLYIRTKGVVTINGISSSHNYNTGIDVGEFSSLTLKNAVLNNSVSQRGLDTFTGKAAPVVLQNVTANDNALTGLLIRTAGSISLSAVDTVYNHDQGIYMDNTFGTGTGPIALTSVTSSNNSGDGIRAYSDGSIALTSVKAFQNAGNAGAYLDNSTGTGSVTITSPASAGFAGANSFSGNNLGYGLYIQSKGTVTVTNVEASSNFYDGLYIYIESGTAGITINKNLANWTNNFSGNGHRGIAITTQGIVNISSSSAFDNQYFGIDVTGKGAITLTDVQAFNNRLVGSSSGLRINNSTGTGGVTIRSTVTSNFMDFSGNAYYGIDISSHGAVSVSSVKVNNNDHGLYIDNSTITTASPSVTISNGEFNNNNYIGVRVWSKGAITLTNVSANGSLNDQPGVELDNTYGVSSGVTIKSSSASVFYEFSHNTGSGIKISSKGAVSVSNVIAQDNIREGILINTQGTVAINKSTASDNQQYGISITGKGAITLTDVEAYNNGAYGGLYIDNTNGTGGVTIRSTVLTNYMDFSDNDYLGIHIKSNGAVSISSVKVNNNGQGLFINNSTYPSASPSVTISNGEFNNNNYIGVRVWSKGAITLTNVSANGSLSGQPGVELDNTYGVSSGVTIKSSSASAFYEFSHNTGSGIKISSKGAVAVSNVIAEDNGNDGIYINNYGGSDKPVSITASTANGNTQDGIDIITKGAVTLTNTGASENVNGYGATISNEDGTALTGVTIRSTLTTKYYDFSGSGLDGIYIISEGAVSVGNVIADENGNYGLNIDRTAGAGAVSITRGAFDHNTFGGVQVLTTPGVITLTDMTASDNGISGVNSYSGALIDARIWGVQGGSVTVKSSLATKRYDFSNNSKSGLEIYSSGPISVSNVNAEGNEGPNVFLANDANYIITPKPVTVANSAANGSKTVIGFQIYSLGAITLTSLTANDNDQHGLYVNAINSLIPANVTLTGARNEFSGNGDYGVRINTKGNITLSNIIADNTTDGTGIYLDNDYSNAVGNVTISAAATFWNSSSGNDNYGLFIRTRGTVTISRLHANENGIGGINSDNTASDSLLKNVTLTSVDANRNRGSYGLYISSLGAVTLNSTRADSNEQHGILIETNGAVSFNGVSASYNSTHEADIPSANAIINERLTSDAEGDIWHFVGNNAIPYTITLSSTDFDAYLKIFHFDSVSEMWVPTIYENDDYGVAHDAQIIIPSGALATDEFYYVLATTADQWGIPGGYVLSFNGSGTPIPLNRYDGAKIDNRPGNGNVTITSPASFWTSFNENNGWGLNIYTDGTASITNTDASNNGYRGMDIHGDTGPADVTIRNTSTTRLMEISNNEDYGINVYARGAITISGRILANDNGSTGVYLVNNNVPVLTPKAVTLTSLTASNNQGAGIFVESIGAVTLSSITANGNQSTSYGVYIRNNFSRNLSNLTINGSNNISNNKGDGLYARTYGTLSVTGVRAESNEGKGLDIGSTTTGKSVTLSNIIAQYNGKTGVDLDARGTVTLTNVRSCVNGTASVGGDGINIYMIGDYHITINNSAAIGNAGYGIVYTTPRSLLHLLGTYYFGNNSDNVGGEADLYHAPL